MLKINILATEESMELFRKALYGSLDFEENQKGFSIELGEPLGGEEDLVLTVDLTGGEDTAEVSTEKTEEQVDEPSDEK